MAKTLADNTIQVEKGDTLSGIYGSNWKTLSGYTGDPTKLQIGTILPAKSTAITPTDISPEGNVIPITTLNGSPNPTTLPTLATQTYPTITPPPPTVVDPMQQILNDYTTQSNANAPDPKAGENAYNADVTNAGISGLQGGVNTATNAMTAEQANLEAINAQLTTIANEATQGQLQLESNASGKDVTTQFLSRQGQEISRQSAIRALPLQSLALVSQAKIQNLKGNVDAANTLLSQAQDRVNKLFEIQQTDAKNTHDYKQNIIDKFLDFATEAEKTKMANLKDENNKAFTLATANRSDQNSWASSAISAGQGQLAGQIMKLDASSPTFQQDLANLTSQIKEKTTTTPTIKSGNLVISEGDISKNQQLLNKSRGQSYIDEASGKSMPGTGDAFANSKLYMDMYNEWVNKHNGLEADFFESFPPTDYLNPNDTSIPQYIRNKIKATDTNLF